MVLNIGPFVDLTSSHDQMPVSVNYIMRNSKVRIMVDSAVDWRGGRGGEEWMAKRERSLPPSKRMREREGGRRSLLKGALIERHGKNESKRSVHRGGSLCICTISRLALPQRIYLLCVGLYVCMQCIYMVEKDM